MKEVTPLAPPLRTPGSRLRHSRRQLAKGLYATCWRSLVVIPTLLLSTSILFLPCLALAAFSRGLASRTFAVLWARINLLFSLVTISISGRHHVQPDQPYLVVANHQSYYDIYALYGFSGIDLRFVMKQELRKVPIIGLVCEAMGHVYLDRSNAEAAVRSLQQAQERIVGGTSIVFFPEGTRSPHGRLQTFKRGAFKLAVELELPILPVTLHGAGDILPPDGLDLYPGHIHMAIHPPVPVAGLQAGDTRELMQQVHRQMEQYLHLPAGTEAVS